MSSSRPNEPVMHCTPKQFRKVLLLGKRLIKSGLYANADIFDHPTIPKEDFGTAVDSLDDLVTGAKGDHKMKVNRDEQSIIVFDLLNVLLLYVKPIVGHDANLILLSGFDLNDQPQDLPVPDKAVIDRIEEGKEKGTYKVFLKRKQNKTDVEEDAITHMKNVKFNIEITTTVDVNNSWIEVAHNRSSTNLVFTKVTPNIKNWIRVTAYNNKGDGQPSDPHPFTPQS